MFGKRYVDAAGKPTLAPWAVRLARDSRLTPDETRTLGFAPPQAVVRVRVELVMRLLPPPLAKQLGLEGTLEAEPRVVLARELTRVTAPR